MRIEPIPIGTGKGCAAALLVIGLEALQLVGQRDIAPPLVGVGIRSRKPDHQSLLIEAARRPGRVSLNDKHVVVALERTDLLQQQVAAKQIVERYQVSGVASKQFGHDHVSVVAVAQRVATIGHLGFFTIEVTVGARLRSPTTIVDLGQAPDHPRVAVVGREGESLHGSALGKGHVAQSPIEVIHAVDDEQRRRGSYLLKGSQIVMWEAQQRIGQLALLGLDEIVEEELGLSRIFLTLHHVGDTLPVAEIVFVVDSPVLFHSGKTVATTANQTGC